MKVIYNDSFKLMGTNYHQQEALAILKKFSKENHYIKMSDDSIREYILKTGKAVYKYHYLESTEVTLVRDPKNPHDSNAIKVFLGELFAGFVPSDVAQKINRYLENSAYSYQATLQGTGGEYKTLNQNLNKVVWANKDISFYLDLVITDTRSDKDLREQQELFYAKVKEGKTRERNKLILVVAICCGLVGFLFAAVAISFLIQVKILEFIVGSLIAAFLFLPGIIYKIISTK